MPNEIKIVNKKPRDYFVNSTSRYAESDVIYYGDQKLLTYKIYKRTTRPTSSNDRYAVISSGWEYRPDLASMAVYGVPDFWYRIMEDNGIKDIMDFVAGKTIRMSETLL
jgi:hypothetical protein